jgi:hypothetical protein
LEDVISLSLESEPRARPLLWVFWGASTILCTLMMDNLFKAAVIVFIRFARRRAAPA